MSLNDHPAQKQTFDALMAEKEAIRAQSDPLRKQRAEIHEKMHPLTVAEQELSAKIQAIESPRLSEIDNQLASIARATGGRTLSGIEKTGQSQRVQ